MGNVDLNTGGGVRPKRILCELGDGAHCGFAVYCKAEKTIIPGRLAHPKHGGLINNPSVERLCAGEPRQCPSREAYMATGRTQQDEAARARRVHEIQQDLDSEILEEFTKPTRRRS
jgi:hypothetical protein